MRRYLIDTSILTAGLFQRRAATELLAPMINHREAATSVLVYGEVVEYLQGKPDFVQRQQELRELLVEMKPYFVTYRIMERYAQIRRDMRRRGPGIIGDVDTMIAATALERGLTIITADTDFQRVPNLNVQLILRATLSQ